MISAKVVAIGDELLIGQITNSNAAFIGSELRKAGFTVKRMVTVGDDENDILKEFEDSIYNFDVTIITGGLGPTHDDLTKPLLVKFFNDKLELNEEVLKHIESLFQNRKTPMPEINRTQAEVPSSSEVIFNKSGTAPGMWFDKNDKVIISLPGVPYEMKEMMTEIVINKLIEKFSDRINSFYRSKTIITTGITESGLYELLGDQKELLQGNKIAYLPSAIGVRLRIDVDDSSESEAETLLSDICKELKVKLGKFYVGDDEQVEIVSGELLRKLKLFLSVAESCTGGMISEKIVSVAGSSDYYNGGICTYSDKAKIDLLDVSPETLNQQGAVSEQTAIEMAIGSMKKFNSDVSISTTGIAGPTGGSNEKPVGLVWIGYADKEKSFAKKYFFGNNRQRNIERATQTALNLLRLELLNKTHNH